MIIAKVPVRCEDCSTLQYIEIVTNAPIAVFTASLKAARCVKCGDKYLVWAPTETPPNTPPT